MKIYEGFCIIFLSLKIIHIANLFLQNKLRSFTSSYNGYLYEKKQSLLKIVVYFLKKKNTFQV